MGLVISLKVIYQVKNPKHISTNILDLTPVDIGCEINLTFLEYYILPTLKKAHPCNSSLDILPSIQHDPVITFIPLVKTRPN